MIQSKALRLFGAVLPLVLLVIITVVSAFGIGEGFTFNPFGLIIVLHTVFLTVIGIIVATVSARSYLRQGNLSILLLGTAVLTFAVVALVGGVLSFGLATLLDNVLLSNYGTIISNISTCISSAVQLLSAIVAFTVLMPSQPEKRTATLAAGYMGVVVFIAALTVLTFSGVMPAFITPQGPTLLRTAVQGVTVFLFASSGILFFWRYQQSKAKTLYWYSLALGLFAVAFLSFMLQVQLADSFGWIGRVAEYTGSIFFLLALLQPAVITEKGADLPERWAEAFGSDRSQIAALFNVMLDAFIFCKVVVDKNGRPIDWIYLDVNEARTRISGLAKRQMVGKRVSEVYPEENKDPTDWIGKYGRVALTGEPLRFEGYRQSLKKWVHTSAYSPKKGYFVATFEDITEGKKAEEALRESEKRYSQLFNSMAEMFQVIELIYNEDGKAIDYYYRDVNPAFEKLVGKTREQLIDRRVKAIFGIVEDYWLEVYEKVARTGNENHFENFGAELNKWYDIYAWKANDKQVAITFTDITERKKAEDSLVKAEVHYRTLFSSIGEGFELMGLIFDDYNTVCDLRYLEVNDTYEKQTGLKAKAVLGKTVKELFPKIEQRWIEVFDKIIKSRVPTRLEDYHQDTNRYYSAYYFPFGEKEVGVLFSDITDRKKNEEALRQSERKLDEYSKNLEKLVVERTKQLKDSERLAAIGATAGMVGHDIRNPLQAITSDVFLAKSELEVLAESENKRNAIESLNEVEVNIDYINKIVADLQDYARPLNPLAKESNIQLIVKETLSKIKLPNNLTVAINIKEEAQKIVADPDYIKRIISNLVLNAVQAMPDGGKLTVGTSKDKTTGDLVLTVEDTGVGIPDNVKDKLFTPMFTTKSKGQGFGLAVVKRMAETLGGTVTFESQEGKGTIFTVRLPPKTLNGK